KAYVKAAVDIQRRRGRDALGQSQRGSGHQAKVDLSFVPGTGGGRRQLNIGNHRPVAGPACTGEIAARRRRAVPQIVVGQGPRAAGDRIGALPLTWAKATSFTSRVSPARSRGKVQARVPPLLPTAGSVQIASSSRTLWLT